MKSIAVLINLLHHFYQGIQCDKTRNSVYGEAYYEVQHEKYRFQVWSLEQTQNLLQIPGGGTQIWKWRTSACRRTKIGGIRCKISSKKRGSFSVGTKNMGAFFRGGRKRLPKFKFSAKFPIGLHVILQIQIKKFENDCYIMWKIILTENPSRCNLAPLLK